MFYCFNKQIILHTQVISKMAEGAPGLNLSLIQLAKQRPNIDSGSGLNNAVKNPYIADLKSSNSW